MNKERMKKEDFISPAEGSSINAGDILITSYPFASVLKSNLRGQHCDTCFSKRPNLQRCSGCTMPYYCHRECQKNGWGIHKHECKNFKKLKPIYPTDTCRLMARIIFRLKEDGYDYKENIKDQERKFCDLVTHEEEIDKDPIRSEEFVTFSNCIKALIGEENTPAISELKQIFGKISVNSFHITDKDLNPVGLGLYIAGSIFNHSCIPNAYASFVGTKLTICSLIPWSSLEWDKVKLCYIDILNRTDVRQKELKDGYFFTCECVLCKNTKRDEVLSSIVCGNSSCTEAVFLDLTEINTAAGPCTKCGFSEFDERIKSNYEQIVLYSEKVLTKSDSKKSLSDCKTVLEKQNGLLHSLNYWKVKANEESFEAAISCKAWSTAIHFGTECLTGFGYHYGERHPFYGLTLLKLAKIELYNFSLGNAYKHLKLAESIIKVSHGTASPLYENDVVTLLKQAKEEINMVQSCGFNVKRMNNDGKAI